MVKGDAVVRVIIEIMKDDVEYLGRVISVDGKAIRSTSEKGKPLDGMYVSV